jgi:hypothetical protein
MTIGFAVLEFYLVESLYSLLSEALDVFSTVEFSEETFTKVVQGEPGRFDVVRGIT